MSFTAPHVLDQVARDVAHVEEELERMVRSDVELVHRVASHTLQAGGKRLRPAIVAVCARAVSPSVDMNRVYRLGACLELIHMATLVHDDVIDHAATRRGKATAAIVFGNTASILSGDAMLAKAMATLAADGDLKIIRTVSEAVVELAEGEVAELHVRGDFDLTEAELMRILRMKTASIIRCCCQVGALIAGANERQFRALTEYGEHVGLAFQIIDDVIDYDSDANATGKRSGVDFREGTVTLPLIRLRDLLEPDAKRELANKFGNQVSETEMQQIVEALREGGAFESARAFARDHVQKAICAIDCLDPSPDRELLKSVGAFTIERKA